MRGLSILGVCVLLIPEALSQTIGPQGEAKACINPRTEEERAIRKATRGSLAQVELFLKTLRRQGTELEQRLKRSDAPPNLVEIYRNNRRQVAAAEKQRAEFERLAGQWCKGP